MLLPILSMVRRLNGLHGINAKSGDGERLDI